MEYSKENTKKLLLKNMIDDIVLYGMDIFDNIYEDSKEEFEELLIEAALKYEPYVPLF